MSAVCACEYSAAAWARRSFTEELVLVPEPEPPWFGTLTSEDRTFDSASASELSISTWLLNTAITYFIWGSEFVALVT